MTADESTPEEERYTALFAAAEEAAAAGRSPPPLPAPDAPPEWQTWLEHDLACARLLRDVLSRWRGLTRDGERTAQNRDDQGQRAHAIDPSSLGLGRRPHG